MIIEVEIDGKPYMVRFIDDVPVRVMRKYERSGKTVIADLAWYETVLADTAIKAATEKRNG